MFEELVEVLVKIVVAVAVLLLRRLYFILKNLGSMVKIIIITGQRSRLANAVLKNALTASLVVVSSTSRQFGTSPLVSQPMYAKILF